MRFLAESRSTFDSVIDRDYAPETSIVCRYRNAVRFDDSTGRDLAFKRLLLESSIREGVRIAPLLTYKGVAVHVLDETSWMATGSLKSVDGCLSASLCRMDGIGRVVFESGGNSGSALTRYGRNAGLETFFFCPLENVELLDSRIFGDPKAHLVAVEERDRVKALTALFAKRTGIRQVPDKSWRYAAAMFRGMFLLEEMFASGGFDWISQTISAAFGPIGIYRVLEACRDDVGRMPRFLGIQQETNCPMYRAWKPEAARLLDEAGKGQGRLLTRIMYDRFPGTHETWPDLQRLLVRSRGDLLTVNEEEFDAALRHSAESGPLLELLQSRCIDITLGAGQILDKAGMIALAGTLKAIDAGVIPAGDSVLCALTGGAGTADGLARPERTVREERDVLEYAGTLAEGG